MTANWPGLVAVVLTLIAFRLTYRFLDGRNFRERLGWVLVSGVLALPGASFTLYYLHWLPEPWWYFEFRSWRGVEFLLIFCGILGGGVATFFPGVSRAVPLAGTLAFAVVPFLKPILGPLPMSSLTDVWRDDVCMQSVPSTCGAASSATVLRSFGIQVTEREVARAAYSYVNGTEAWYLARFLRSRGCKVRFRTGLQLDSPFQLPAIVGVRIAGIGHFVPFLEQGVDGEFVIGDPLRGREKLSRAVIEGRYFVTGWAMEISPPTKTQPASRSPDGG